MNKIKLNFTINRIKLIFLEHIECSELTTIQNGKKHCFFSSICCKFFTLVICKMLMMMSVSWCDPRYSTHPQLEQGGYCEEKTLSFGNKRNILENWIFWENTEPANYHRRHTKNS